jgi:hypothetical protein
VNGKLLAQLSVVAWRDSEAQYGDPYKWPAPPPPTDEAKREGGRLRVLSSALMHRAREAGFFGQSMDEIFGE